MEGSMTTKQHNWGYESYGINYSNWLLWLNWSPSCRRLYLQACQEDRPWVIFWYFQGDTVELCSALLVKAKATSASEKKVVEMGTKLHLHRRDDKYFSTFTIPETTFPFPRSLTALHSNTGQLLISHISKNKKTFPVTCTSQMPLSVSSWKNLLRLLTTRNSWSFHLLSYVTLWF